MSTPPTKRRRIDFGIHKPFVSPLKDRNTINNISSATTNPITNTNSPSATSTSASKPSVPRKQSITPYTPLRSSTLKFSSTPTTTKHLTKTPNPTKINTPSQDPDIVSAQQTIKTLELRLRILQSQTSTLQQASSLPSTTSSSPSRLSTLTQKWLQASQLAAEQVFSDFSSRVKDNGGLKAMRQSQSQIKSFDDEEAGNEGEEEEWRDEMGDVLTERGVEARRMEGKKRARKSREGERDDGDNEEEGEEEEEEVTIGKMLGLLNIPFEDIAWDEKGQTWKI